jgi:hypothetical protein
MQPSSATPDASSGSNLRRYGPLAVLVVLVLVVGLVIVLSGGDDDETSDGTGPGSEGTTDGGGGEAPEGAISFSRAEEEGLDVTFMDTCDEETGRVALPYYFRPECYANVEDNGGATAPGVTEDTITVVVYITPDVDPILDYITAAIANDDTGAQSQDTYTGYTELFQSFYQTYGRKVELKFLVGSGGSDSEVAARADATKAVEELGAFAVWGGPVLAPAWTETIKNAGVICLGCPAVRDPAPTVFPIVASGDQTRAHLAEYIIKKLAGKPAEHAGDEELASQDRVFGHVYIETVGGPQAEEAEGFKDALADGDVELAEQIAYSLDPATIAEQAAGIIEKLKAAGVTTVIFNGDPIAPKSFTEEATKQNYFPEWLYGGSALVDTNAFGRTYDQEQWAHAFGISSLAARVDPEAAGAGELYEWFHGTEPPADQSFAVLFPQPALFFSGLQAAGPNLTAETFRAGLFSGGTLEQALTAPTISYGDRGVWPEVDYYGIDDFTEIWWDPDATGEDEIGREGAGMMRFVDGGKRYLPGDWPSDLRVFEEEGTVTVYEEIPEAERPPEYESPKGGG